MKGDVLFTAAWTANVAQSAAAAAASEMRCIMHTGIA